MQRRAVGPERNGTRNPAQDVREAPLLKKSQRCASRNSRHAGPRIAFRFASCVRGSGRGLRRIVVRIRRIARRRRLDLAIICDAYHAHRQRRICARCTDRFERPSRLRWPFALAAPSLRRPPQGNSHGVVQPGAGERAPPPRRAAALHLPRRRHPLGQDLSDHPRHRRARARRVRVAPCDPALPRQCGARLDLARYSAACDAPLLSARRAERASAGRILRIAERRADLGRRPRRQGESRKNPRARI